MASKSDLYEKWRTISLHNKIFDEIKRELKGTEPNLKKQINKFHSNPNYKEYSETRNDKGYNQWKTNVQSRFDNTCCVCLSKEQIIIHHLYSYKYYPELRVDINNGVCLCKICHDNFNDMYSNSSGLKQFIEFRNRYKGEPQKRLSPVKSIRQVSIEKDSTKKQVNKLVLSERQQDIIKRFEELRDSLASEMWQLMEKYGNENGIKISFREKNTTSKSAISTLSKEIMRINRLIICNKMADKTKMAEEFHMPLKDFLSILEDPKQYLKFKEAEIVHLGLILNKKYQNETKAVYEEMNAKDS